MASYHLTYVCRSLLTNGHNIIIITFVDVFREMSLVLLILVRCTLHINDIHIFVSFHCQWVWPTPECNDNLAHEDNSFKQLYIVSITNTR